MIKTRSKSTEKHPDTAIPTHPPQPPADACVVDTLITDKQTRDVVLKAIGLVVVVVLFAVWIIVTDAFLIKNAAGFTIVGLLRSALGLLSDALFWAGSWFGRLMNIMQLLWDLIDAAWQFVLPYLPLKEAIAAKNDLLRFVNELLRFSIGLGAVANLLDGFVSAIKTNMLISIITSFVVVSVVVGYIRNKIIKKNE